MKGERLNLLNLKDRRISIGSVTGMPAWRYLSVVSWVMAVGGAVACIWATSGHLDALPEEAAGSISAGFFVVFAVAGAMAVCWCGTAAAVHALAAAFLMLTVRRAIPVDTLADVPEILEYIDWEESDDGTGDAAPLHRH